MKKSTTQLTEDYINDHPYIKNCLLKELINYSSLSRLISRELKIQKKTSKEAILIAARRFVDKYKGKDFTPKIKSIFLRSEIEIKNKIHVFTLEKILNIDYLIEIQKNIRKQNGMIYVLEGSEHYTIIISEKYSTLIKKSFNKNIIEYNSPLALIKFKSPEEIEKIPGVTSYMTTLFSENGVNIVEFLSCWRDTLFLIDPKDVHKVLSFLNF